jgi:hypothetical protein
MGVSWPCHNWLRTMMAPPSSRRSVHPVKRQSCYPQKYMHSKKLPRRYHVILLKRYVATGKGPSHKELWKKIEAARKLVAAKNWVAVGTTELNEDFDKLGEAFDIDAYSEEGQNLILADALAEIKAENYFEDGAKISKALATAGMTLWTFRWQSQKECFGKSTMYIKFCIEGTGQKGPVYIHCIHVDNPPPDEEGSTTAE